ncbi:MAG: polysaccharide deacetylase family protein [bacterium]
MPRLALPQDYVKSLTLWQDFEILGDWVKQGENGTVAANTSQYHTGSQSVKLTSASGSGVTARRTLGAAEDIMDGAKNLHFWIYVEDTTKVNTIVIVLFTTVATAYYRYAWSGVDFRNGWNHMILNRLDWAVTGAADWGSISAIQIQVNPIVSEIAVASWDSIYSSVEGIPRCVIAFDDACESAYTEGYAYMHPRGVRGTIYVVPTLIGTAGYCTLAQLEEMYDAGWALANHSYTHPGSPDYLTGLTRSQIESELSRCSQWLIDHGFTRAAHHLAYPGGYFNDDVFAALDSTGMYTGRSTLSFLQTVPVDNYKILKSKALDSNLSLAVARSSWIDRAISRQSTVFLHGHILDAVAGPNTWAIADFRALIDYITARGIKCVTIDEWYNGLTNPKYRAIPISRAAA